MIRKVAALNRISKRGNDLDRIRAALVAAGEIFRSIPLASVRVESKGPGQPVTDAERRVNELLFHTLVRPGDGWLSEETADDSSRLMRSRVWVVDPLDGTKEFIADIPEWCVSIGLVENGAVVAGGILNPATQELFLGSRETGLVYPEVDSEDRVMNVEDCVVLASRSELRRGEWERFRSAPFILKASGSVAYKLAQVAAGRASATWTLVPKHEWDVAAGVALVLAAGGSVLTTDAKPLAFNQPRPLFPGLVALSAMGRQGLRPYLMELSTQPAWQDCSLWATAIAR